MWKYRTPDEIYHSEIELYHYGIPGMKWGRRSYRSTSIRSAIARHNNKKIDKSFKKWEYNDKIKKQAIELGKKANIKRMEYENNKNKKHDYIQANKRYNKLLRKNTTYRKGQIKQEVYSDMSRKYLSNAKKIEKELNKSYDKNLQKKYTKFMNEHDILRDKARNAPIKAANRSNLKAGIKRGITISAKVALGTAATAGAIYAANKYLSEHEVTLNGRPVRVTSQTVSSIEKFAKIGKSIFNYI